ncbi:MAG: DUF421 domain-containing protein [Syntrophomonadaceae bacterium]|nr:DUF421 domain-containing protein [Syntrophomonadaceae bacterium]
MLGFIARAAAMYFLALIMIRLLGKRALGELGPFDFVVMTGVGHTVVSVALDQSLTIYEGIVILATLAVLEYLMGFLSLKSGRLSNIIVGRPVLLIDNGHILRKNLAREKFNVDDLFQELRKQGVRDIREVEKGILESCGGFSVIIKEEEEPVTKRDLGFVTPTPDEFSTFRLNDRQEIFDVNNREPADDDPPPFIYDLLNDISDQLKELSKRMDKLDNALYPQKEI